MWVQGSFCLRCCQAACPGMWPCRGGEDAGSAPGTGEEAAGGGDGSDRSAPEPGEGRCSWAWHSEEMHGHQTPDGNLYCSLLLPWLLRGVFKAGPSSHLSCIANHLLNNNSLSLTTEILTRSCISSGAVTSFS